jgi:hypothetical protein
LINNLKDKKKQKVLIVMSPQNVFLDSQKTISDSRDPLPEIILDSRDPPETILGSRDLII